jgi:hypothetical protein
MDTSQPNAVIGGLTYFYGEGCRTMQLDHYAATVLPTLPKDADSKVMISFQSFDCSSGEIRGRKDARAGKDSSALVTLNPMSLVELVAWQQRLKHRDNINIAYEIIPGGNVPSKVGFDLDVKKDELLEQGTALFPTLNHMHDEELFLDWVIPTLCLFLTELSGKTIGRSDCLISSSCKPIGEIGRLSFHVAVPWCVLLACLKFLIISN